MDLKAHNPVGRIYCFDAESYRSGTTDSSIVFYDVKFFLSIKCFETLWSEFSNLMAFCSEKILLGVFVFQYQSCGFVLCLPIRWWNQNLRFWVLLKCFKNTSNYG
jgi:hypothetical protein